MEANINPAINESLEKLKVFLASAPNTFGPNDQIKRFTMSNGESINCVLWKGVFHITGTDIVKILLFRFAGIGRQVLNTKKFEEGVFSDLRNLKTGIDATLEEPRSEFLEFLFKNGCIRTQKKQKVFFWYFVPHDRLFLDALERDLKRETSLLSINTMMANVGLFNGNHAQMYNNPYAASQQQPMLNYSMKHPQVYPAIQQQQQQQMPPQCYPVAIPTTMPNKKSNNNTRSNEEKKEIESSNSPNLSSQQSAQMSQIKQKLSQCTMKAKIPKEIKSDSAKDPLLNELFQQQLDTATSTPINSNLSEAEMHADAFIDFNFASDLANVANLNTFDFLETPLFDDPTLSGGNIDYSFGDQFFVEMNDNGKRKSDNSDPLFCGGTISKKSALSDDPVCINPGMIIANSMMPNGKH